MNQTWDKPLAESQLTDTRMVVWFSIEKLISESQKKKTGRPRMGKMEHGIYWR